MAQRPKPEVRRRFLAAAVEVFDERGYRDASLREVARRAGGTLGNLRAYFPTKNALFEAACGDVADSIDAAVAEAVSLPIHAEEGARQRASGELVRMVVEFTVEHRVALRLLLDRSEGSGRARWRDELLRSYVELEQRRLDDYVRGHRDQLSRVPSRHLVTALCRMYFALAEDFVRGDLTADEFRDAVDELDAFRRAGAAAYNKERS